MWSWEQVRAEANLDEREVDRAKATVKIGVLAEQLGRRRAERCVSVEQVAEELGVEPRWIAALESEDAAEAPFVMFMSYARHLQLELAFFVEEDD